MGKKSLAAVIAKAKDNYAMKKHREENSKLNITCSENLNELFALCFRNINFRFSNLQYMYHTKPLNCSQHETSNCKYQLTLAVCLKHMYKQINNRLYTSK